jgi:hypothetical protein
MNTGWLTEFTPEMLAVLREDFATDDWEEALEKEFGPGAMAAIGEATEGVKKAYPWLCATPEEARRVALSALYPRSHLGARQNDSLVRVIYVVRQRCPETKIAVREVSEIVTAPCPALAADELIKHAPEGSFFWVAGSLGRYLCCRTDHFNQMSESELCFALAEGFRYLENYKPRPRDYAIEALQDAFVGLMRSKYDWGKKGVPVRGEIIQMARSRLQDQGKKADFSKSSWSLFLKEAFVVPPFQGKRGRLPRSCEALLAWLPKGQAGRPSNANLDENVKAVREYKSLCTQAIKDFYRGDAKRALDALKAAVGNRAEYYRSEKDRLRDGQPNSAEKPL